MKLWTMMIAAMFFCFLGCAALIGCGGVSEAGGSGGCGDGGSGGGDSVEVPESAYPCVIGTHALPPAIASDIQCRECEGSGVVLGISPCGIWGTCAFWGPYCVNTCDGKANNDECAPHRHCQQVTQGKPLALCIPGDGVSG